MQIKTPEELSCIPNHKVNVDHGKYTFVLRGGWVLDVLRNGEPWVAELDAPKAISSMMAELDAARVVLHAVTQVMKFAHEDSRLALDTIRDAMTEYRGLVGDPDEKPSSWCGVCICCDEQPCSCGAEIEP